MNRYSLLYILKSVKNESTLGFSSRMFPIRLIPSYINNKYIQYYILLISARMCPNMPYALPVKRLPVPVSSLHSTYIHIGDEPNAKTKFAEIMYSRMEMTNEPVCCPRALQTGTCSFSCANTKFRQISRYSLMPESVRFWVGLIPNTYTQSFKTNQLRKFSKPWKILRKKYLGNLITALDKLDYMGKTVTRLY